MMMLKNPLAILLLTATSLVSGEAEPALSLVGFGDLQRLAQGQGVQGVQSTRDERSLLNTYPFNHQNQRSQFAEQPSNRFPSFSAGPAGRQVPAGTGLLTGLDGLTGSFSLHKGFGDRTQVAQASLAFQTSGGLAGAAVPAVQAAAAVAAAHVPAATAAAAAAPGAAVANYDHLYLAGAATAQPPAAFAAPANLKARRPLPSPAPAVVSVPEVLPQIHVPEVRPVHVPARLPTPAATFVPELEIDTHLFEAANPNRARKPALGREPGPVFPLVAEARERCIDKIEYVEETEYDQVEECSHSYDKKCHTSYSTEYTSQQEEECKESFSKDCDITYSPTAHNETVLVCSRPLVKDCNIPGPEECRTEYVSECWTKEEVHSVLDDVAECETVYDEKCHQEQKGYSTEEKCSKWPREVCSVNKKLKTKTTPNTKCEKVPQRLCGPAGCGFVPGPEQCNEKTVTVVTDLPSENCNLHPRTQCEHVTKLVPKLVPVEECVDVPKEICQKARGPPRTVSKPVTKKWCYTPTPESGLH